MMFEDVLPALRDGKAIQRTSQPVKWAFLKKSPNGGFHWYGFLDDPERGAPVSIDHEHLLADDWVIVDEAEVLSRKPVASHNCPRRAESYRQPAEGVLMDHWAMRNDMRVCSYCGSAHPGDVMEMAEAGTIQFGPTDKNYKAYLETAPSAEDESAAKENAKTYGLGEIILRGQGEAAFDEWWQKERTRHVRGNHLGKFYFQHLDEPQMLRFIELLNAKQLKIGAPGHFYRMPYFCKPI